MNKFHFPRIERPGLAGLDSLRRCANIMLFLEVLSITVRRIIFQNVAPERLV
eukprot:UN24091